MRHAICYVSSVNKELQISNIKKLLISCEEKNNRNGIKGILLFSEGNFFQVVEGQKEMVLDLWEKIKQDPRHYGIIQVVDRTIQKGSYDDYKATILEEGEKYMPGLPPEYTETLKGISPDTQMAIELMMKNFIATRF